MSTHVVSRQLQVLQVEDNPAYARLVQATLSRLNGTQFGFVLVESLADALLRLRDEVFDVILLDLGLEDSQGMDTCRAICAAAEDVPLVVLAGQDDEALAIPCVQAGAQDFLRKGQVDSVLLLRALVYAVERKKLAPVAQVLASGEPGQVGAESGHPTSRGVTSRTLRVLQVEDNPGDAFLVQESLNGYAAQDFDIVHVERLNDAFRRLSSDHFDVVLLDLSLPDSRGMESCQELRKRAPDVPVVVHSGSDDKTLALRTIQQGAQDYLIKGNADAATLARALQMAVARQHQRWDGVTSERGTAIEPAADTATSSLVPGSDRRAETRYNVVKTAIAIPILPDGRPDWMRRMDGLTVDLSFSGIGLELASDVPLRAQALLIGMERADRSMCYAGAEVRHFAQLSSSRWRVGAVFGGVAERVLKPEYTTPRFDPHSMRLTMATSPEVLQAWVQAGVLRPTLLDKVQLCPRCHGLPTFRLGCKSCGSARIADDKLIHHFACAYVGFVQEFQTPSGLTCPKCQTTSLVVGADFDYQVGSSRCLDCHWSDTSLEQVGQCLRCELRFPAQQAFCQELIGYHVDRLDPLAFIAVP